MSGTLVFGAADAVCNLVSWCAIVYLLRRDRGRCSPRTLVCCIAVGAAVFGLLCAAWQIRVGTDAPALAAYLVLGYLVSVPHVLWLFPGRLHKNLFCAVLPIPLMVAGHTAGKHATWFAPVGGMSALVLDLVVTAASYGLLIAGLFWLERKKFPGLFSSEGPEGWRRLWLITLILGVMQLLAGNVFLPDSFYSASTATSRVVCLAAAVAILYIAGFAQEQAAGSAVLAAQADAAAEYMAMKDREFARIVERVEETRRMRHDLSQMTAAMQGMNDRGERDALVTYCEEILRAMDDNKREVGHEDT